MSNYQKLDDSSNYQKQLIQALKWFLNAMITNGLENYQKLDFPKIHSTLIQAW